MHKIKFLLLSLLILAASFLRFYRLDATQTFLEDEGRDMLIVRRMIDTKTPVLLGPQTSTGNMYLGPFYYYFITPALLLSGNDPIGPAILIAITGIITTYLLYYFGRQWFGELAGFLAAALYGLLPYPVMFTRNSWNPNLVPLVMLLLLFVTSKIDLTTKKWSWGYVFCFGILAGILMQLHYMALVGIGATGIYILIRNFRAPKNLLIAICIGFLGLVLTLSPLILFELRNHFVNTKAIFGFLTARTENNLNYQIGLRDWWLNTSHTFNNIAFGQLGRLAFDPTNQPKIISFAFLALIVLLVVKIKPKTPITLLLLITFIASLIVLGFYQERIHLHYLGFFLPVVYLIIAAATQSKTTKWLALLFVFSLLVYNAKTTIDYINASPTNQVAKAREVAHYIVNKAQGRPYNVVSRQTSQTAPFQYFLALAENRPTNELVETLFLICDGSPCNKDDETTTLLYLTGPSHPSLAAYLGHPQLNEFRGKRTMIDNQMVNYGIWVAELVVNK